MARAILELIASADKGQPILQARPAPLRDVILFGGDVPAGARSFDALRAEQISRTPGGSSVLNVGHATSTRVVRARQSGIRVRDPVPLANPLGWDTSFRAAQVAGPRSAVGSTHLPSAIVVAYARWSGTLSERPRLGD